MNKKILCLLMGASMFSANAYAAVSIEKDNCRYKVTADCEPGEKVAMIVAEKGSAPEVSDIVAVREGISDGDEITFTFEFEEDAEFEGKYTVYVNNNNSGKTTEVDFVHTTDTLMEDALNAITGVTTEDELKDLLKEDSEYRIALEANGVKCDVYDALTDTQKEKVRDLFISEKGKYDNLVQLVNRCVAVIMINSGDDTETALLCGVPEFGEAEDKLKSWVTELIGDEYSSVEEFIGRYDEICILYKFNNAKFSEFASYFEEYGKKLGITNDSTYEKFDDLSVKDKSKVGENLVSLLKKSPAKTTDSLLDKLDKAYDEFKSSQNKGTGGGGSSSGGGGGSSKGSGVLNEGMIISGKTNSTQNADDTETFEGYNDISDVLWAEEAINLLTEKGIVSGDGDGSFRPNDTVTREEFAKMLVSAVGISGEGASCAFTDVDTDAWYCKYVSAAYETGIVTGISETEFGVGRNITRQEMAVMISRALGMYKEVPMMRELVEFSDKDEIAGWATEAVSELYCTGIMSGVGEGRFEPGAVATRAQAAVVIYNLIK